MSPSPTSLQFFRFECCEMMLPTIRFERNLVTNFYIVFPSHTFSVDLHVQQMFEIPEFWFTQVYLDTNYKIKPTLLPALGPSLTNML